MKKTLKALSALTLTLVLLLALAVPTYAATTYTITINNTASGHKYEAYQVFTGDLHNGILSNVVWGGGVNGTNLLQALKENTTFSSVKSAADVANILGSSPEQVSVIY